MKNPYFVPIAENLLKKIMIKKLFVQAVEMKTLLMLHFATNVE